MEQETQERRNAAYSCPVDRRAGAPGLEREPGGSDGGAPSDERRETSDAVTGDPLTLSWARTPMRQRLFAETVNDFTSLVFAHGSGTLNDPGFVALAEERIAVLRALAEDPQVSEWILRLEASLWNAVARAFAEASHSPRAGAIG